jgi:hypothetical protein
MTQQVTAILEPQACCYAAPAPSTGDLLRPNPRRGGSDWWSKEARERRTANYKATMAKRREEGGEFRRSRYVGLMNSSGRRDKYRDAERVGTARKLMPHEIDRWFARLEEIQRGEVKPVGPLLEKSR